MAAALAGCAGASGSVPYGSSASGCQSLRSEISRLEARGVQYQADSVVRGAKLNEKQRADVDRYNQLLNQYLGGGCHQ